MAITSELLEADGDFEHVYQVIPASSRGVQGFQINADGDFGGGTLTLTVLLADGLFHDMENGTYTVLTSRDVGWRSPTTFKATLAGATAPSLFVQFTDNARG